MNSVTSVKRILAVQKSLMLWGQLANNTAAYEYTDYSYKYNAAKIISKAFAYELDHTANLCFLCPVFKCEKHCLLEARETEMCCPLKSCGDSSTIFASWKDAKTTEDKMKYAQKIVDILSEWLSKYAYTVKEKV